MSDPRNYTTPEQVQRVLGLLKGTPEHQEQACALIDALSENTEFMRLLKENISSSEGPGCPGYGNITFFFNRKKFATWDKSALFLRLLRWGFVSLHSTTLLRLANITAEDLAAACPYLTQIKDLELGAGWAWRKDTVQLQSLPKEMSLLRNLESITFARQYELDSCDLCEPLNVKRISSEGGTDTFYEQLFPMVPHLESLSVSRTYRADSLTKVPDSIGKCTKLQHLSVTGHYKLKSVSSEIGECVALQSVSFQSSALPSLPSSMQGLTQLEYVNVSNTAMKYIPKALLSLPSLKKINASRCSKLIIQINALFQEKVFWKVSQTYYPNTSMHRSNFVIQEFFDKGSAESRLKE